MSAKTNCRRSAIGLVLATIILLSCGCAQQQLQMQTADAKEEAVSLYVDALMLNELSEYDNAMEKLELATELDPELSVAFSLKGDIYQGMQEF